MEALKGIMFVVAMIGFGIWVFADKWFAKEIQRNEVHEAPSDQQIRWHLRHMRQDLHALVLINATLVMIILGAILLKA